MRQFKPKRSTGILSLEAEIKRDLQRHLKWLGFSKDGSGLLCPPELTKECFKALHASHRDERLARETGFIARAWPSLSCYFADGCEVQPSHISPRLELIQGGTWQSELFRLAALTWSVPVSQGYGRRMRFLVWDDYNERLIGLLALGDPVFNLRVRDEWIGWNVKQREERLVNVLDAYVLGAVPPYNMMLGGKLIACLARTRDVREIFTERYRDTCGIISGKRKRADLCLITTSSALGRSSLYNRLSLDGNRIFISIGYTSGWGHFHIPDALFAKMREYLSRIDDRYARNYGFGEGPNWKLRATRKVLSRIGMDPDLLRHGILREVFVCPLASNAREFLTGKVEHPCFPDLKTSNEVAKAALARWVIPRAERRPEFQAWRRSDTERLLHPQLGWSSRNGADRIKPRRA
ncbi:MAG: DUF4338 domain-containing protein [Acidobacteriota bacterium]|nr:DUF4338 domain-containing protein [Blastocatellia bacterium]MDW8239203.1 DUF4338 domain-containing protein [Acidobacteriota bacterium]